jgi:O-methyltransferase involved in polyketide biosynthesis
MGEELFHKLIEVLPADLRIRILERKLSPVLSMHLTLRARKYDALCLEFLDEFPAGLIVNLGCGFDTRFWRLGGKGLKYIELDLPSVIQTKKQLLGEKMIYQTIESSVLDKGWIGKINDLQEDNVLFIAEGLFMYLPEDDVKRTLKNIAETFQQSRMLMEVVAEKYTRGFRKKMVELKMRKGTGSTAGDYFQYGIRNEREPETYHPGIHLKSAWSYYEDPDIKPQFLKLFKHVDSISRTQYTVVLDLNPAQGQIN